MHLSSETGARTSVTIDVPYFRIGGKWLLLIRWCSRSSDRNVRAEWNDIRSLFLLPKLRQQLGRFVCWKMIALICMFLDAVLFFCHMHRVAAHRTHHLLCVGTAARLCRHLRYGCRSTVMSLFFLFPLSVPHFCFHLLILFLLPPFDQDIDLTLLKDVSISRIHVEDRGEVFAEVFSACVTQ